MTDGIYIDDIKSIMLDNPSIGNQIPDSSKCSRKKDFVATNWGFEEPYTTIDCEKTRY